MNATLNLNLSDALNADELRELTAIAITEGKSLERVLFEAAKAEADRRRRPLPPAPTAPAMAA